MLDLGAARGRDGRPELESFALRWKLPPSPRPSRHVTPAASSRHPHRRQPDYTSLGAPLPDGGGCSHPRTWNMDEAPGDGSSAPRESAPIRAADQIVIEKARFLYDSCPSIKPAWDQLGGVTQSVWIERAQAGQAMSAPTEARAAVSDQGAATPTESASVTQASLF